MSVDSRLGLVDGDHVVRFYERDEDLAEVTVGYFANALLSGDVVVATATSDHHAAFRDGLEGAGIDVERAEADGQIVTLDAIATLERLMVDGHPDSSRFDRAVGEVVRAAVRSRRRVRAYGEMVAVLWAAGDVVAAIELEDLWNELAEQSDFALFCAYPTVANPEYAAHFEQVCRAHSQVVAGAPATSAGEMSRRFAGATDDPRRARRFVQEALSEWSHDEIIDNCLLVVGELTANAVRHARSDFTVSLTRADTTIQITVGDSSDRQPRVREPDVPEAGGRGLRIVDAIATRWGHQFVDGGKLVWAHIPVGASG
jgi:anti-sigma regulatory factor (Ser/Thr protein kinase)